MRGRIDAAKWSEGRAVAGSIRTACRAFQAEKGTSYPAASYAATTLVNLGFAAGDLDGKYFTTACYVLTGFTSTNYTITVTAASSTSADKPTTPSKVVLDQTGTFTDTP